MNEIKVYIFSERSYNREQLEQLLRTSLNVETDIRWIGLLGELTIYGSYEDVLPLYALINLVNSDLNITLSMVITPHFDDFFAHIVKDYFAPGVSDMTQRCLQLWSENHLNPRDIPPYLNQVPKEQVDTVKAFIQSGLNASAASRILYIHRNTFHYRMNKFIEETGLDLRQFHVATFVQLLLSI